MSIDLIIKSFDAEKNPDFHILRLLILLSSLKENNTVAGLTKLAKLDFLLRYPNCLERALKAINYKKTIQISSVEINTIETSMTKHHYGPWDKRYREWISLMQAKDLVTVFSKGKTVYIGINGNGRAQVERLIDYKIYADYFIRSEVIISKFNSYSGKKMLEFIYNVFPEISRMKIGEEISL